jgi:hypothetical protein
MTTPCVEAFWVSVIICAFVIEDALTKEGAALAKAAGVVPTAMIPATATPPIMMRYRRVRCDMMALH